MEVVVVNDYDDDIVIAFGVRLGGNNSCFLKNTPP